MALYIFSNPENPDEIVEITQSIHDCHEFYKDGVKWNREFTIPTASIDTKWDCNNPRDFVEKTSKKKGTMNDIWDQSAILSEKREKMTGKDEIKEKYIKEEKKRRKGKTLASEYAANKNKVIEV